MVLVGRIVAEDVHVEAGALLDHCQANASGSDDRYGLAGDLVAEKWQVGMPVVPLVFAGEMFSRPHLAREGAHHKKRELGGSFGEHVGGVGEWDFVTVRVGAIDVVEADRNLGDDFKSSFSGFEHFG